MMASPYKVLFETPCQIFQKILAWVEQSPPFLFLDNARIFENIYTKIPFLRKFSISHLELYLDLLFEGPFPFHRIAYIWVYVPSSKIIPTFSENWIVIILIIFCLSPEKSWPPSMWSWPLHPGQPSRTLTWRFKQSEVVFLPNENENIIENQICHVTIFSPKP